MTCRIARKALFTNTSNDTRLGKLLYNVSFPNVEIINVVYCVHPTKSLPSLAQTFLIPTRNRRSKTFLFVMFDLAIVLQWLMLVRKWQYVRQQIETWLLKHMLTICFWNRISSEKLNLRKDLEKYRRNVWCWTRKQQWGHARLQCDLFWIYKTITGQKINLCKINFEVRAISKE